MTNTYEPTIKSEQQAHLTILYKDDWCIVVDKPAGLLSVPGRGPDKQDCVHNRLLTCFPNARVVHRLDMATSGILLFAQHYEAQKRLSQAFAERKVSKEYMAVVQGSVQSDRGKINAPMRCDWENRPKQMICEKKGKASETHYSVEAREKSRTRVKLRPITGRTHQLRLHMQHIGHPILGDQLYANEQGVKESSRLLLHASKLNFPHPQTNERMIMTSTPDF